MKRRDYIVGGGVSLSAAASGCLRSPEREYRDEAWVNIGVLPDDIRVGVDSEQYLDIRMVPRNVMARRLPDENQEHHITIDTSPLEQYGVDLDNLSVKSIQPERSFSDTANKSVDAVDISDGVIDLVIVSPEDVTRGPHIRLQLTGFQFADVEAVTNISYDIQSPDDHLETGSNSHGFKLIDPQLHPPTLSPRSIMATSRSTSHSLSIDWLTPEDDEVYIEIDMSTLDDYGTINGAVVEREIRGAILEEATIDGWAVSLRLAPDSDSNYAAVSIRIEGITITAENPVENLSHEMTVEGDANETVETEPFDITEETYDDA